MRLPHVPLVVLDTETTGFVPRVHRVIEFACAQVEKGEVVREVEQLFSIDTEIPPHVRALTHIHDADLRGQPTFKDARDTILAALPANALIVGQNVSFDIGMLKGEGIDLSDRPWIDTSMLASLVFPELESYSLGYVSEILKLPHEPKHRALGDVRATLALLEACWTRLSELPEEMATVLASLAMKSDEGYRRFFAQLKGAGKKAPKWLTMPSPESFGHRTVTSPELRRGEVGTVTLLEESLTPSMLESVLHTVSADTAQRSLVAVKNIEANLRRLTLPEATAIHYPPMLLVDPDGVKRLLAQESLTADEATLAMKLYLYDPRTRADLPIHGEEYAVWNAKIGCTPESATYADMLRTDARVILLDHRELLTRAAEGTLPPDAHVIIDDATMLEESATKAYGWYCPLKTLRASAQGDATLTRLVDLIEVWTERTRSGTDVRYLTMGDLNTPDVRGMAAQIATVLPSLPRTAKQAFDDLLRILDPDNFGGRIAWIETRMDGERIVQSVPGDTASVLKDILFDRLKVTLLTPPIDALPMILPRGMKTHDVKLAPEERTTVAIEYPSTWNQSAWLTQGTGKSILLLGSRRLLEELYVREAEKLEAQGITLFCQGLSGGQGRMQAQFAASMSPAIMALTPWTYEGMELPPASVDRVALTSLPFDHPSHALVSQRSELFGDGFMDYMLPRLTHRLFRILRTFCRHRTQSGIFEIADTRLFTKEYGKNIRAMLELFSAATPATPTTSQNEPVKKSRPKKKPDDAQPTLF